MDSGWHCLCQVIILEVSLIVAALVRGQKKEALYIPVLFDHCQIIMRAAQDA